MTEPTVQPWNVLSPRTAAKPPPAPEPDEIWDDIGRGTAWVYRSPNHTKVVRPVIISDGFNSDKSELDELWHGMERGEFPFITELRNQGSDLIILGYNERSASILENAEVATACILKAASEPSREVDLAVGGFSMGGLVTRYALAKMEHEEEDHHTELYFSYDSPHRGAWIPICLQAQAHFLRPLTADMSNQINSPAARQLLLWHIAEYNDTPAEDPLRREFLDELNRVGWWPREPHKLALANGSGSGDDNGVPPGAEALKCTGQLHIFNTTTLYTQASGDNELVAKLKCTVIDNPPSTEQPIEVYTNEMLEFDGAPGGTLESFGIARDVIATYAPLAVTKSDYRSICFVPSISAVAIRDPSNRENLYVDISELPKEDSELDEFLCATDNQAHSLMTEELGRRLLDRLPK